MPKVPFLKYLTGHRVGEKKAWSGELQSKCQQNAPWDCLCSAFVIPKSIGAYSPILNLSLLKTAQLFCRHSLKDLKVVVYNGGFRAKPRSKLLVTSMHGYATGDSKEETQQKTLLNTDRN